MVFDHTFQGIIELLSLLVQHQGVGIAGEGKEKVHRPALSYKYNTHTHTHTCMHACTCTCTHELIHTASGPTYVCMHMDGHKNGKDKPTLYLTDKVLQS